MKSNPMINTPEGLTLTLQPYLAAKLDNSDAIPVLRDTLEAFTEELEEENPGMQFDFSQMNQLPRQNLWFIDILQNDELAFNLLSQILEAGQQDSENMNLILAVMKEHHLKEGFKIEGNKDFFARMQKVKQMLAQDTLMEDEVIE